MAKIDLGLILPSTGTLIYTDGVSMNYNIPTSVQSVGRTEIFSTVSEDTETENEENGE